MFAVLFTFMVLMFGSVNSSSRMNIKAVFPSKASNLGATRLVLTGTLPDMSDVTVCQWINAAGTLKTAGSFLTSYAHGKAANEFLIGIIPSLNGSVKFQVSVRDTDSFITTNRFQSGQWHHLCVSWSSGKGRATAYLDGHFEGTSNLQEGQIIRTGGVLVLGQDQDIYNGKFDVDEAWEGSISDVQIWDEVLQASTVQAMAECKLHLDGNVVAWMKTPFRGLDSVVLSHAQLCSGNDFVKACNN